MSISVWSKQFEVPVYPQLEKSLHVDVCIVGSGIAGLTAAYALTQAGKQVVVLSESALGGGESSRTTAQINTAHDDSWTEMKRIHGQDNIRICYQGYCDALNFIQKTVEDENIECGFEKVPAYLFLAPDSGGKKWLEDEIAAAHSAGVQGISLVSSVPVGHLSGEPAIRYENQGQFQPLGYITALAGLIRRKKFGEIYTNTRVVGVEGNSHRALVKLADGHEVIADAVVLASNVPMHHRLVPQEALAAYRSYVLQVAVKKNSIPLAQYWDNGDPYHYVRKLGAANDDPSFDMLLVGGEDHRVGETEGADRHFSKLEQWAREKFPAIVDIRSRWSGQTIETFDGMPLIGRSAGDSANIFIITGDSGTGMTHGTLGGLIVTDLIFGRANPLAALFDPKRPRRNSLSRWFSENVKSVAQYQDWLKPAEVSNADEIIPGSGAILRKGLHKVAVYKDHNGECREYSAVCPHLGGIVRWNALEQSWDCPVHGSRFSCTGKVLNGPASCGLVAKDEDDDQPIGPVMQEAEA